MLRMNKNKDGLIKEMLKQKFKKNSSSQIVNHNLRLLDLLRFK